MMYNTKLRQERLLILNSISSNVYMYWNLHDVQITLHNLRIVRLKVKLQIVTRSVDGEIRSIVAIGLFLFYYCFCFLLF